MHKNIIAQGALSLLCNPENENLILGTAEQLDGPGLERLRLKSSEIKGLIDDLGEQILALSLDNHLAEQEEPSKRGYSNYIPGSIVPEEQAYRIREAFSLLPNKEFLFNNRYVGRRFPRYVEGLFVVFPWYHLTASYSEACLMVIKLLEVRLKRKFINLHKAELLSKKTEFVISPRTAKKLAHEVEISGNRLALFPGQFGFRHRGRSALRAEAVLLEHEWLLDPFSIIMMLLAQPERLQNDDDLCIMCAGGTVKYEGKEIVMCFMREKGKLILHLVPKNEPYEYYGAPSGFSYRPSPLK
jgi:hypothetical protein